MKALLLLPLALLAAGCGSSGHKYKHPVVVAAPTAPLHESMEPTSAIIETAAKGDTLELYSVGSDGLCGVMHRADKPAFKGNQHIAYAQQQLFSIPDTTLARAKQGILH